MKRNTLKTLLSAVMLTAGLAIATATAAEQQVTPPQTDFTVKFEWDSRFIPWKASGDPVVIGRLNAIINESVDDHLVYRMMGYAVLEGDRYATTGSLSYRDPHSVTESQAERLETLVGAHLFVVDASKDGTILLSRKLDVEGLGLGQYGSDYGCMQNHIPIFRADLNHDGHPEVFYFTSQPNELNFANNDWVDLNILDGITFKEMFSTRLVSDAVSGEKPSVGQASKGYSEYGLGSDGFTDFNLPGQRSFAKLLFGDLQKTRHMQLLVWRRDYEATQGWQFAKEHFELYTMSPDVTFTKTDLTPEQGHALLEKNNLTWKQGFPNQNFCNNAGNPTDKPLIPDIDDPVLKQ